MPPVYGGRAMVSAATPHAHALAALFGGVPARLRIDSDARAADAMPVTARRAVLAGT